jgi:4-amino-4-deoxy-L-arabinose transferase-like glycosyltransferase
LKLIISDKLWKNDHVVTHFCLLVVLAAAILLRFWGITERGIVQPDAYTYANIAKTPLYALEYTTRNIDYFNINGMIKYLENKGCFFYGMKPFHTFVLFVSFAMMGIRDWAILLPSAIAGTLTVWIVYLIGYRFFCKEIGLIAALLLCFSSFQVAFSRSGYPQSLALLMFTLLLYFYLSYRKTGKQKFLYATGFCLSLGILTHISIVIPVIPIFGDFIVLVVKKWKKNRIIKPACILIIVVLIPILIQEGIFFVADLLTPYYDIKGSILWSFEQNRMLGVSSQGATLKEGLYFYFDMISEIDGPGWALIYLVSMIIVMLFLFRERNWIVLILILQIACSFLFWSVKYPTLKSVNVCYASVSLIAGYVLWKLASLGRHRNAKMIIAFMLIAFTANIGYLKNQLEFRVAYKQSIGEIVDILNKENRRINVKGQRSLKQLLMFYLPFFGGIENGGNVNAKKDDTLPYCRLIHWADFKDLRYVNKVVETGHAIYKKKIINKYMPITFGHRLKNKGVKYERERICEDWYCLWLYEGANTLSVDKGLDG